MNADESQNNAFVLKKVLEREEHWSDKCFVFVLAACGGGGEPAASEAPAEGGEEAPVENAFDPVLRFKVFDNYKLCVSDLARCLWKL